MLSTAVPKQPTSDDWAVDSAATDHMCNNKHAFTGPLIPRKTIIRLGDHSEVRSNFYGTIILITNTSIRALYVPEFRISLLSVQQLDKDGWTTTFRNRTATLLRNPHQSGTISLTVPITDNLYRFKLHEVAEAHAVTTRSKARIQQNQTTSETTTQSEKKAPEPEMMETLMKRQDEKPTMKRQDEEPTMKRQDEEPTMKRQDEKPTMKRQDEEPTISQIDDSEQIIPKRSARKGPETVDVWHRRLAHLHHAALTKLLKHANANVKESEENQDEAGPCDICVRAKHTQKFERKAVRRASAPFELIHSDIAGPFQPSAGGATYYIVYIDDYTRHTEVYFLTTKSAPEVVSKFKHFQAWVRTQGYQIKRFRCDNGRGEFNNSEFQDILSEAGIAYEPAPPFTQHKNGVAERMIRTLNTKGRCMMLDAKAPMRFWAEAIKTACYLHRRTPTSSLPANKGSDSEPGSTMTPHEALYGTSPKLHHLRRFGCVVYKHIPKEQRSGKFSERSRPCMMLGYVHQTTKIWRIWDFSSGPRGRAVECSNVIFAEDQNACEKRIPEDPGISPEDWPEEEVCDDDEDDDPTVIQIDGTYNDDNNVIYDNNDDDDDDDDVIYDNK
jgi:transposase InsO family protein